ncbi:MAG: T9SS type A sorting domain-containing protein [Bacteroidetes bacterium]|nr:T9SS type A sorting domain-containing protein [Bacteroidota bacterium]
MKTVEHIDLIRRNNFKIIFFAVLFFCSSPVAAQLTNGGINAYFGVDGDTRNNYSKYGIQSGLIPADDWFSSSPLGQNIIDTSNASYYLGILQSGAKNLAFNKRMSTLLYSKVNGKLWLDAVYGRDYICTSPLFDSTIFTTAAKNGDNPINWLGGTSNTPDKNDLLDVYAHMRRDGTSVYDSLWVFTGVSTVGAAGSRYFDIEFYKKAFTYSAVAGKFTTAGTEAGHTEWLFDASGNIIQSGDMIIAVNFSPGAPPVVDMRIWVSSTTFASVIPTYFRFGANFDGATPAYGYASILSKLGATNFGSGISNYSTNALQDTTYSTPWGTEQSTKVWGAQYLSQQFIEVGLNLTRIGLDPSLYNALGISPCESLFSSIFFKSRSSNSFVSNMQDFVTPMVFVRPPLMDYSIKPDTLRCNKPTGTIQVTNNSTAGYYTWKTTNGDITGASSDSSQINLNKPGTYIVSSTPAVGCPIARTDTIVIPIDTFPPVASFITGLTSDNGHLQFYGGDLAASNYPTPFGGSQGLLWNWSGPGGFSSTIQNPINDTTWGTYQLTVTEKRNGCTNTVAHSYTRIDFWILANGNLSLSASYVNSTVDLKWQDLNNSNINFYEIEKSTDGINFSKIAVVMGGNQSISFTNLFSFMDYNACCGNSFYRVKALYRNGTTSYSNIVQMNAAPNSKQQFFIAKMGAGSSLSLVANMEKPCRGNLTIYNILGQVLQTKTLQFSNGMNVVDLNASGKYRNSVNIVSVILDNGSKFVQKTIF